MPIFTVFILVIYGVAVFRRPHWGIYTILALLPSYQSRFQVLGIPTTFLEWLILILAASVAANLMLHRLSAQPLARTLPHLRWLVFAVGLLGAAGAVAVAVSPVTLQALGIFKAYVAEGIIFWLLCLILIDSKTKLYGAIRALGLLVTVLAVFGIYQYATLSGLPPAWWGPGVEPRRVVSLFTYPNAVALLIAPVLALYSGLFLFRKKMLSGIPSAELILVNISGIVLLFLTFSRGGWLAYMIAIAFLALFSPYKKMVIALIVAGGICLMLIPAARHRVLPVITGTDPAGLERIKLYEGARKIILEQPLLGGGLMGFRSWYGSVKTSNSDEILNYPHNFFLNFWVEMGAFGLLAVILILYWTGYIAKKIILLRSPGYEYAVIICSAWLALLVHGLVDVPFFKNDLAILFWFLASLLPITLVHSVPVPRQQPLL